MLEAKGCHILIEFYAMLITPSLIRSYKMICKYLHECQMMESAGHVAECENSEKEETGNKVDDGPRLG